MTKRQNHAEIRPYTTRPGERPQWKFASILRENPGRWAYYGDVKHPDTAKQMRKRYGLEAVFRTREDGRYDIYARHNPSNN